MQCNPDGLLFLPSSLFVCLVRVRSSYLRVPDLWSRPKFLAASTSRCVDSRSSWHVVQVSIISEYDATIAAFTHSGEHLLPSMSTQHDRCYPRGEHPARYDSDDDVLICIRHDGAAIMIAHSEHNGVREWQAAGGRGIEEIERPETRTTSMIDARLVLMQRRRDLRSSVWILGETSDLRCSLCRSSRWSGGLDRAGRSRGRTELQVKNTKMAVSFHR